MLLKHKNKLIDLHLYLHEILVLNHKFQRSYPIFCALISFSLINIYRESPRYAHQIVG
jgi:hypothetical protein